MSRRRERGFTLAEAIISITILGLMGTVVFGTFSHAMTARDTGQEITDHYHQVRQAMMRMARELQMAYVSDHRDCDDPRSDTVFKSESASRGMRLDFTSFSHYKLRADANVSDQNELSYYIDRHPDPPPDMDPQAQVLIRREQARVDDEPDEGGLEQVLAENVTNLEFEFYDPKDDDWTDEWDTKNMDYKGRLPMFVTIKLTVKDPEGEEEEFVTKTRLHIRRSIRITGTGFVPCQD